MSHVHLAAYPGANTWIDGFRYSISEKDYMTYVEMWTSNNGTWAQWKGQERLPLNWEYV